MINMRPAEFRVTGAKEIALVWKQKLGRDLTSREIASIKHYGDVFTWMVAEMLERNETDE